MKTTTMRIMSIITTITMENAAARIMTMSTIITIMRSTSIIITTIMMMNAAARIMTMSTTITTTMMSVAVAAMTMSITIIMQMRCSQAGVLRPLTQ